MKSVAFCLFLVLSSMCMWAQTEAPAQPASPQAPAAQPTPPMHHPMGSAMHEQHMQEMKAQLAKMHTTLDQMKLNLTKLKDPAARQQAQFDVDLWQAMVQHLDDMVKMMSEHPMGPGAMGPGGMGMEMGCCAGMKNMKDGAQGGGCCRGMKDGAQAGGCCGGNKCMQPSPAPAPSGN